MISVLIQLPGVKRAHVLIASFFTTLCSNPIFAIS